MLLDINRKESIYAFKMLLNTDLLGNGNES